MKILYLYFEPTLVGSTSPSAQKIASIMTKEAVDTEYNDFPFIHSSCLLSCLILRAQLMIDGNLSCLIDCSQRTDAKGAFS